MIEDDPRTTLARADLADQALEGIVRARRYGPARALVAARPATPLHRAPAEDSERLDEVVLGETFEALESAGDYLWGRARRDGYVGYARAADLGEPKGAPTHFVRAIRTYAFAEPSIKSAALGPVSLNALVRIEAEDGGFGCSDAGRWFWTAHLSPIGVFERDAAAVAERLLGTPYLWGGRTSLGLDCSGLVQQALYACGRACPRDADQQAGLGRAAAPEELRRGDLVCWRGHIGLMLDPQRLIHANAHAMAVAIELLAAALARIEAAGVGPPTAFRRL